MPPLKNYQTGWDLKTYDYSSLKDPKIEKDTRALEKAILAFAKKYKGKSDYLKNEGKLLSALKDLETLEAIPAKALMYVNFVRELDSENREAEALINRLSDRFTKAGNEVIFFGLSLGKIDKAFQKKLLKSPRFAPYRYFLESTFETAKYNLSEPEEKILSLKRKASSELWVDGVEKAQRKLTINFKGEEMPLAGAMNKISMLPTEDRRALGRMVTEALRGVGDFAEGEMNAVAENKKVSDELRGYKEPYSATIIGYENDERAILNLVKAVSKGFPLSQRFHALKQKALGLPHMEYADRAVSIGKTDEKIPFEEGLTTVRDVFYGLDESYGSILDRFLKSGQIDVFPKKGKAGGAYCSGNTNMPTMVLLNHVDNLNSTMTLAHEMGHAIHTEKSKAQPVLYQDYSTSVAETASTLFEALVFDSIFKKLSGRDRAIALHDKIQDDIQTIFRQIAFFNFELEFHQRVRKEGFLDKDSIAALLNKHMQSYLGKGFKLSESDGYFFVAVMHFRRPFYVYSYAYGQLISKALVSRYKKDPAYIKKIDQFLTAGGSKKPEQIFKDIGLNTLDIGVFEEGLKSIKADIDEFEKLLPEITGEK
ncbi:M3 family oligoendopeptidase [Candidatus Parcubacteria bacterium]|nr:M3 family oligoendopeptidase [Candidatus Parcubacteria bacterium]